MNEKTTAKNINLRWIACRCLLNVYQQQQHFDADMVRKFSKHLPEADQDFVMHLVLGVLRQSIALDAFLQQFLKKPMKNKDFDITIALWVGLFQIQHMRVPNHAAVNETVKCATLFKKQWAKGLINAVLNQSIRNQSSPKKEENHPLYVQTAHPHWLTQLLEKQWPDAVKVILQANNQPPPITLRVNPLITNRQDFLALLAAKKINASPCRWTEQGIALDKTHKVPSLPRFSEGAFSVQDQAAQLAVDLLAVDDNQMILDACAAPGGKTTAILERVGQSSTVIAVEKNPKKMPILQENLARLQLDCKLLQCDATQLNRKWSAPVFDRVLLDPPCSATGVIRRHPEIKYFRKPEDLGMLQEQQRLLLDALWPLLKPNGLLVYSTCSVLHSENEDQIAAFLSRTPDAECLSIEASWGEALHHGRQILPGDDNMDGFYYAKLRKLS